MSDNIPMDRLVQAYSAIRDARTAKRHQWEAADALLETDMNSLRAVMLGQLNAMGGKSIATVHGTVYRTEKLKPSAADWGAIWDWAKENDGFEIVEKRLKATFIKEYMEQNEGRLPPGVNAHREFEVAVRRPTSSTSTAGPENDNGE